MIAEYNRKSLALGLPGLVLNIGCYYLLNNLFVFPKSQNAAPHAWVGVLLELGILAGSILFMIGLGYYAKSKGYSGLLGLLGVISCIGLLILALLPDKRKSP